MKLKQILEALMAAKATFSSPTQALEQPETEAVKRFSTPEEHHEEHPHHGLYSGHPGLYHFDKEKHRWTRNGPILTAHPDQTPLFEGAAAPPTPEQLHEKGLHDLGYSVDDDGLVHLPDIETQKEMVAAANDVNGADGKTDDAKLALNTEAMKNLGALHARLLTETDKEKPLLDPNMLYNDIAYELASDHHYKQGFFDKAKEIGIEKYGDPKMFGQAILDAQTHLHSLNDLEDTVTEHIEEPSDYSVFDEVGIPKKKPNDSGELDDWLESEGHSIDYNSSGAEIKAAYEHAVDKGVDEEVARDYADSKNSNWEANHPDDYSNYDEWAENEYGNTPGSVSELISMANDAEGIGANSDKLSQWISEKLNNNTSQGGVVNDENYRDRALDPERAYLGSIDYLTKHGQEQAQLKGEDGPEKFSSAAEALSNEHIRNGLPGLMENLAKQYRDGHHYWEDDEKTGRVGEVLKRSFSTNYQYSEREKIYSDVARYIDKTRDGARYVLSDEAAPWLDSEYRPTQYTTVPSGDSHTRTEREDEMGIGRVNYAALGFEAADPPTVVGANHSTVIPQEEYHYPNAEYADFNTRGYGRHTFFFSGVDTDKPSHAIDDTYFDPSYCDEGGWKALLPNAASFAAQQQDYSRLLIPTSHAIEGPNFLELHPSVLSVDRLSRVNLSFPASGGSIRNSPALQSMLPDFVRRAPQAHIYIPLSSSQYYPSEMTARRSNRDPDPRKMLGDVFGERITAAEAKNNIDQAREKFDEDLKKYLPDHDTSNIHLHLPYWYRSETGEK